MTRETLKPNDFPIEADDKKLIKQDGNPLRMPSLLRLLETSPSV